MKNYLLKSFQIINIIGLIISLIGSLLVRKHLGIVEDPNVFYVAILAIGWLIMLTSHMLIIPIQNFVVSDDELAKKYEDYEKKYHELEKLGEFMKKKAFESTVATKQEINEHMGWNNEKS